MKALRDALKRRSVPEEVLRMIEKELRYGTRVVGLDALSLAVLSFYTIGWTRRQARLQQIRDGLQDLGVNLLSLGRISVSSVWVPSSSTSANSIAGDRVHEANIWPLPVYRMRGKDTQ